MSSPSPAPPARYDALGVGISAVGLESCARFLLQAANAGVGGYVCVTGVHGVMESQRDADLRRIHNASLLTVPDGMPLVWIAWRRGLSDVGRVYGPDLMRRMLAATSLEPGPAAAPVMSHFLLGSTPPALAALSARVAAEFPAARIAGSWSPPFRPLTEAEWTEAMERVRVSGAGWVWVGLSTPKQERFMAEFLRRWGATGVGAPSAPAAKGAARPLILVGVGAAFDILSGRRRDAPTWMKKAGLQWLYRMMQEPARLGPRYAWIVPAFLWKCMTTRRRRRDG